MKKLIHVFAIVLCSCSLFAGTQATLTINYQNTTRDFIVYLPTQYSAGQHFPLVFNLHGYTSNASQQMLYTGMNTIADANNFIVIYPDGISNSWNSGFVVPYHGSYPDDVGFISKLIDTAYSLYQVDLTRVYACGISNGGFMSYRLGCELENRIAAIASVAATMNDTMAHYCTLQRKVPVMEIHGTADPLVPYNGGPDMWPVEDAINFWVGNDNCSAIHDTVNVPDVITTDSSTVQKIHYNTCGSGTKLWFYKITGGGHSWPNGIVNTIYGPTNRDINGSQEIWDFFKQFTLNNSTGINEAANPVQVNVWPNPFGNEIKVEADNEINSIALFNLLGEKVAELHSHGTQCTVNTTALAKGFYMMEINGNDFRKVVRIAKE